MNTLVITYDLNRPGQDYSDLYKKIKSLGDWKHPLESTWIVKSQKSYVQARDLLLTVIDSNDKLLIVDRNGNLAWYGMEAEFSNWLKSKQRV